MSISNLNASNLLSAGKQTLGSISSALATDETQQAVSDVLTLGVEGIKTVASIFGLDLSGLDSEKIGETGGSIFGKVADMAEGILA